MLVDDPTVAAVVLVEGNAVDRPTSPATRPGASQRSRRPLELVEAALGAHAD